MGKKKGTTRRAAPNSLPVAELARVQFRTKTELWRVQLQGDFLQPSPNCILCVSVPLWFNSWFMALVPACRTVMDLSARSYYNNRIP